MNRGEPLPIVLCCAEDAEVALVAVVDALHQEGFTPEVVPGVETDADLLTAAADRIRGRALFVLCQSDDLDRFQVRRLQGLFSARKGPEHQMITVDVQAMGAMSILPEVRVAAQGGGLVGPRDDDDDDDDGRHMRDVIITSAVAAPGASIPNRPRRRPAVAQEPEGISDEALGMLPEESQPAESPRRLYPEPDVLIATDPTGETISPFGNVRYEERSDGIPKAVEQDFPVVGDSSSEVEAVDPSGRIGWGEPSGPIAVDRVKSSAHRSDTRAEQDATPLPSVSSPIQIEPDDAPADEPEPEERRGGRIGLLLLAGAGMAGVVAMAVLHGTAPVGLGPAGGEKTERGIPVARGQTSVGGPRDPGGPATTPVVSGSTGGEETGTPGSSGSGGATTGPGTDAARTGTGTGTRTGTGTGETGAGESDADDAAGSTTGATPASAEGGAAADGGGAGPKTVPPPPTADPSATQLEATIEAALAAGRLEAMGDLLVSRAGTQTMTWDEAAARCKRRKVEGLRRWRLPSKGQLVKLRKARLLAGGSYWSRSEVGGDEVYAYDASSGRLNVWLKMEPNARPVCVRKRP